MKKNLEKRGCAKIWHVDKNGGKKNSRKNVKVQNYTMKIDKKKFRAIFFSNFFFIPGNSPCQDDAFYTYVCPKQFFWGILWVFTVRQSFVKRAEKWGKMSL